MFSTRPCRVPQFSHRSYNNHTGPGEYTVPMLVVTVCLEICMICMTTNYLTPKHILTQYNKCSDWNTT